MKDQSQSDSRSVRHLAELQRLIPLENDLALLPVGWGAGGKAPMLTGWQQHSGFTVNQLRQHKGIRAVGARTGVFTGPLLAFDFDGESALELGLYPWTASTWQIHRDNDAFRLKALFRPTPAQISQIPQQPDGSIEFQGKTITATATKERKGEALEVFFAGGRQVIVLGEHLSSGGSYIWRDDLGPEALAPPPNQWWEHALEIAQKQLAQKQASVQKGISPRSGTRRLNPCPICGRHNGLNGSDLWCSETKDGLILCIPGSTFNCEQRHGQLAIGDVVEGYALVKRTPAETGEALTFKPHQPSATPSIGLRRFGRPRRSFRAGRTAL